MFRPKHVPRQPEIDFGEKHTKSSGYSYGDVMVEARDKTRRPDREHFSRVWRLSLLERWCTSLVALGTATLAVYWATVAIVDHEEGSFASTPPQHGRCLAPYTMVRVTCEWWRATAPDTLWWNVAITSIVVIVMAVATWVNSRTLAVVACVFGSVALYSLTLSAPLVAFAVVLLAKVWLQQRSLPTSP
jgi:hypothetical protein